VVQFTAGNNGLMSKQKMLAARELIQEKRYAEARALLKTIDDPTAKAWLKKLDEIAPEKKSGGKLVIVAAVVVVLAIIVIVGVLVLRQNNTTPANQNVVAEVPTQMELPSVTATITHTPTVTSTVTPSPTNTPTVTATPSCNAIAWWQDAEEYLLDFLSYTDIAMETAMVSVGNVLVDMQHSKRDFERLDISFCYADAENSITNGMDFVIKGFGDFQSDMALTVSLNILYARQGMQNGIDQLAQLGLEVDDVQEMIDDLFGDWSLYGLSELGEISSTCSNDDFIDWQNHVEAIVRDADITLPMDVGDIFDMNIDNVQNAFVQIAEVDYPSCVEEGREALLLALDHGYQAGFYFIDGNTYSSAEHITDHELEYQTYLHQVRSTTPSKGESL
jgi:hypothetical protein